ncbi:MAG: hypothetical protein SPD70_02660, partial [Collinsella sp.]|nr:hypothetical protein [Collinsella sp.]
GLSVPDDVSVIGFDDELYKTIPNSILTSVKFATASWASVRLTRSSQVWKPRAPEAVRSSRACWSSVPA